MYAFLMFSQTCVGASVRYVEVDDMLMLPFATLKLTESCDAVIAAGLISGQNVSLDSMVNSLFTVGTTTRVPVIPGVIYAANFEPGAAGTWVSAACSLASMKTSVAVLEISPRHETQTIVQEAIETKPIDAAVSTTSIEVPSTPVASTAEPNQSGNAKDSAAATAKKSQHSGIFAAADSGPLQPVHSSRGRGKPQGSSIVFG